MTDPFKLRVLKAATDLLKTITPANGYVSDLSDFEDESGETVSRVYRGKRYFGADSPLPMVSFIEGGGPADLVSEPPLNSPTGEYDWVLSVTGFVADDPQNPTDPAYQLLADVRRCLATEAKRKRVGSHQPDPFGIGPGKSSIISLSVGPGVVLPPDDEVSPTAYFWVGLTIRIVDNAEAL